MGVRFLVGKSICVFFKKVLLPISNIALFFLSGFIYSQSEVQFSANIDTIANRTLQILISKKGAEIKSIKNKENQMEWLWQGDKNYWGAQSPILFPFVGKLWNESYHYNNQKYAMKIHGFANEKTFELIRKKKNEIWYKLTDDEETYQIYPFQI